MLIIYRDGSSQVGSIDPVLAVDELKKEIHLFIKLPYDIPSISGRQDEKVRKRADREAQCGRKRVEREQKLQNENIRELTKKLARGRGNKG